MAPVAAKQLIFAHHGGRNALEAVDAVPDAQPWDYEDPSAGRVAAILGSEGLLRLAATLSSSGFRTAALVLGDEDFEPLEDEAAANLEDELISDLRLGLIDEALARLLQADVSLISITVRRPKSGQQFHLNRDGQLRTRFTESPDAYLHALERALINAG